MRHTPSSKSASKVKTTAQVVSIMVSMDEATRLRFSERANQALKRKEAERQAKNSQRLLHNKKEQARKESQGQYPHTFKTKQQSKGISYWLFSASFAEIFKKLING